MSSQSVLVEQPHVPGDVVWRALAAYWRSNPELGLGHILNSTAHLTNIRALLPAPYNAYHTDSIRDVIHKLSKGGKIPRPVMVGEKTLAEHRADKLDRTSAATMRSYLDSRQIQVSEELSGYYETKEWQEAQRALRSLWNYTCQSCHADHGGSVNKLHCHHHSYGNGSLAAFVDLRNLWLLCSGCHSVIHFLRDTRKDPDEVAWTLFGETE